MYTNTIHYWNNTPDPPHSWASVSQLFSHGRTNMTTRGHPIVLVRINLFIVKLQSNYCQHDNIHLLI